MAIGPQCPSKRDVRASRCLSVQGCGRGTNNAALSVATALEVGERDILNGTVALDGSRDALGSRRDVRVLVRLVEGVDLVRDGGIVDITMGGDNGSHAEGWKDELHVCVFVSVSRSECSAVCSQEQSQQAMEIYIREV